jgi:hypothetical protein
MQPSSYDVSVSPAYRVRKSFFTQFFIHPILQTLMRRAVAKHFFDWLTASGCFGFESLACCLATVAGALKSSMVFHHKMP